MARDSEQFGGRPVVTAVVVDIIGKDAGYRQMTSLGTATALADVATVDARSALLQVESGAIRIRADGTDPTATVGFPLAAGVIFHLTMADLKDVRVIETTGSSILGIWYVGVRDAGEAA